MSQYIINKGVDKSIEGFGLKSHYVFIVIIGIAGLFFLATILMAINLPSSFVIPFIVLLATILIYGCAKMNSHFGENGLTKLQACSSRYRYLSNRKSICRIINKNKKRKND